MEAGSALVCVATNNLEYVAFDNQFRAGSEHAHEVEPSMKMHLFAKLTCKCIQRWFQAYSNTTGYSNGFRKNLRVVLTCGRLR